MQKRNVVFSLAVYNTYDMHTIDPKSLSPSARQVFKHIEFDENEKLLYELRKHWFGLFVIYAFGTFVTLLMLGLAIGGAALSQSETDTSDIGLTGGSIGAILIATGLLLSLLSLVVTAIAAYLYRTNVVLVTSDKLSQLLNQSIFNRKISQLSIGDVQDVTVAQRGIFAHAFHYGTLVIETAGEQQNYTFTYAPNPYEAAKIIVNAHEENLKQYGN